MNIAVSPSTRIGSIKRSWTPSSHPTFRFFDGLYLPTFIRYYKEWMKQNSPNNKNFRASSRRKRSRYKYSFQMDFIGKCIIQPKFIWSTISWRISHFSRSFPNKDCDHCISKERLRMLQEHFFPHISNEIKFMKRQALRLKRFSTSSSDASKDERDEIHRTQTFTSKSKKKRSDEREVLGVDNTEPFERNLREQEGRRYLLWRKVTGWLPHSVSCPYKFAKSCNYKYVQLPIQSFRNMYFYSQIN